jgi:hypothetical protein
MNQSIEDASRREFEAWAKENGFKGDSGYARNPNGEYILSLIQQMWVTWQASRQSSQSEPVAYEFCKLCNGVGKVGEPPIPCAWCRGKTRPSAHAQSEFLAAPQQAIPSGLKEFAEEVKGLCNDFSSRTGNVYIKDVQSAIDGLLELHTASPTAPIESDK